MASRPQITITMSQELLDRWKQHIKDEQTDGTVVGRKLVEQYLDEVEGRSSVQPTAQGAQLSPDIVAEIKRVVRLEHYALSISLMRGVKRELMESLLMTREQLEAAIPLAKADGDQRQRETRVQSEYADLVERFEEDDVRRVERFVKGQL